MIKTKREEDVIRLLLLLIFQQFCNSGSDLTLGHVDPSIKNLCKFVWQFLYRTAAAAKTVVILCCCHVTATAMTRPHLLSCICIVDKEVSHYDAFILLFHPPSLLWMIILLLAHNQFIQRKSSTCD
jgi:hypothetical protein